MKKSNVFFTAILLSAGAFLSARAQTNIKVNQDISGHTQNQPSISINPTDPNILVIGSHDYRTEEWKPAFYVSTNGGATWTDGLLSVDDSYVYHMDPSVAFDANGNVYYSHISFDSYTSKNGIFVHKSEDNGSSWVSNTVIDGPYSEHGFEDRPYITCDAVQGSNHKNNVYVSWHRVYENDNPTSKIYFSRLEAGAGSFSSPVQISQTKGEGAMPAVGRNGVLYVTWLNRNDNSIKIATSLDGGENFNLEQNAVTGINRVHLIKISEGHSGLYLNSHPSLAVDVSGGPYNGNGYLVWADEREDGDEKPDVYISLGHPDSDGYFTWSSPKKIYSDPYNRDQWFPWVCVGPDGVVHIIYYSSQNDPSNIMTDVYVATSYDACNTFSYTKVNDNNGFDPRVGSREWENGAVEFMGDYIGIASSGQRVFPIWTDTRSGNEDLYIEKSIFSNTTWSGTINVLDNVTVNDGVLLTIKRGTTVNIANGKKITAKGTLSAIGEIIFNPFGPDLELPVTFNNGSIVFDGSGAASSILDFVEINNGKGIRCLNGANVTIENSTFTNCTYGVYIYNSAPDIIKNVMSTNQSGIYGQASGMSPLVKNNTLEGNGPLWVGFRGIWFYSGTQPFITHNDVSGYNQGIAFGGNVTAYFSNRNLETPGTNNRVRDNVTGISGYNNCVIYAGEVYGADCNNSLYDNSGYDVSSTYNSIIYAQRNYWGSGGPSEHVDGSSTLYTDFELSYDPWGGPGSMIKNEPDVPFQNSSISKTHEGSFSQFFKGFKLEKEGKIDKAVEHYKNMLSSNEYTSYALTSLYSLKNKYNKSELMNYFKGVKIENEEFNLALKYSADDALKNNRTDEAIEFYDKIIENHSDGNASLDAKFEKLFAYINVKNEYDQAEELLVDIKAMDLGDEEWQAKIRVAEQLLGNSNLFVDQQNKNFAVSNQDDAFSLSGSYPNPFNPSTKIKYKIPKSSFVKLKVYNSLGEEVAILVDGNQKAGEHSANFDASNLASGLYFYRLNVGNKFVQTKKMLLIK